MNQEKIGKFIRQLRKEKKFTQKQLAERLSITENAIGNWENGRRMPDYSILKDLCEVLGTNVNELLYGEKISQQEYSTIAEENLINLKKQIDKRKNIIMIFYKIFASILVMMFLGNMVLNYLYPDGWDNTMFLEINRNICMIILVLFLILELLSFKEK